MELNISPNPSIGIFNIDLGQIESEEIKIEVFNILGKKVLQRTFVINDGQIEKLDLTKQDNGIYFLSIKFGSTMITRKIAVQH